ncbi:MAG: TRAP transporter large permease [Rhodospirillaceae bacterium]|jgi:tripartite ATP-independent transporter DctM subunit|nr:TRAP transporter large permease [Rhodospirillaceae bacterium]MBT3976158.1 TRAP transporter large permease [Rhodospirillaceae bacterium]MBT4561690.1 TRAP transporter large permease [Rhodospirillaceae bacterium]MBT4742353.1 TRAP transporter large permease [Rhodospirillaceae bacterium]MBT5130781.1 TRAP transporter large permease [Rhodospirillaceae bacterium]
MDPITLGILALVALTVLLMSGIRIAFATAITGFIGLWVLRGYVPAASLASTIPQGHLSAYTLLVLPLFIMMGFFAFYAGITRDLYWAARQWVGHLPGGLAIATIFGSAGFAAASGASTASAAVMGRIALPELKKYGYDDKVSTGCVAAGGTLATMIPPSVLMVIYGFIAEESIGALLLAGILPGLLEAFSYSLMLVIRFKINPELGPPIKGITWADRFKSIKGVWGMVVLVILVMGTIYTGIATPTEAAAVGALGALLLALPGLNFKKFRDSMVETARSTAMIFAIVAGVLIFVHFLGFTGMPAAVSESILSIDAHPTVVLIAILAMYLVLGMFLDGIGMLLLTVPIILPTIKELGIDPIVFGVLVVRMVEIGLITPPVGLNVYILKGVAPGVKMGDMFKGCGWFVFVDLINVAILIAFPAIILLIPNTMIN